MGFWGCLCGFRVGIGIVFVCVDLVCVMGYSSCCVVLSVFGILGFSFGLI